MAIKINRILIIFSIICLWISSPVFAEIVNLKSGKIVEGKIIEKTPEYIAIDSGVGVLYYQNKYIKNIEENTSQATPVQAVETQPVANSTGVEAAETHGSDYYLEKGLEYASTGNFKGAENEFKRGLQINESDSNIKDALTLIDDVNKGALTERFASSLFQGSLHLMKKEYSQAVSSLEDAIKIKPDDPDVSYNLGLAYYHLHEYKKAIDCLKKALDTRVDDAEAYELLGNVYYSSGEYKEAKEAFLIARKLFQNMNDQESAAEVSKLISKIHAE